jgi:hypothetical protein
MKMRDVKILWGRAANRCSFPECRIELSPEGGDYTIGEIAHIVAESSDGPRGEDVLPLDKRDEYQNLILLCPTHHTIIDNNPTEWTVERLKQIKQEHEKWVSIQLEQGNIVIHSIDNSSFLDERQREWKNFAHGYVWIISSITPLSISEDSINPLESTVLGTLHGLRLPNNEFIADSPIINRFNTRPNENGIVNEKLNDISYGLGHRIQIFRNGHSEIMICLERSKRQITDYASQRSPEGFSGINILRYTHIAECIINEIKNLKTIWDSFLPFKDMLLTVSIVNTTRVRLYKDEAAFFEDSFGAEVTSGNLIFSYVVNKNTNADKIWETAIKRFVNYFGLIIDHVHNERGNLIRPRFLYS